MTERPQPLPADVEARIDEFSDEFVVAKEAGDIPGMEASLRAGWNALPEPKFGWDSSQILTHHLIAFLRDTGKAHEALELSDLQFASGTADGFSGDPMIFRGSTLLALGRVDEARTILQDVLSKYGKREFVGENSRFLEFAETGHIADDLFEISLDQTSSENLDGELPDEIHEEIVSLSEAGNQMLEAGNPEGAVQAWREATELLPEPRFMWEATSWLFGSIGDVLVEMAFGGEHDSKKAALMAEAREALVDALAAPDGPSNPLFQLRFGQIEYELGREESAREALLTAYMLAGDEIFEPGEEKYRDFLRSKGDI